MAHIVSCSYNNYCTSCRVGRYLNTLQYSLYQKSNKTTTIVRQSNIKVNPTSLDYPTAYKCIL